MEVKFSCGENKISEYLEDGWIIVKENSQEKMLIGTSLTYFRLDKNKLLGKGFTIKTTLNNYKSIDRTDIEKKIQNIHLSH